MKKKLKDCKKDDVIKIPYFGRVVLINDPQQNDSGTYQIKAQVIDDTNQCTSSVGTILFSNDEEVEIESTDDIVTERIIINQNMPNNNDGRDTCAWCGAPTRVAGGGLYNVCTACGR